MSSEGIGSLRLLGPNKIFNNEKSGHKVQNNQSKLKVRFYQDDEVKEICLKAKGSWKNL